MKKTFLFFLLLTSIITISGQIKFEKGYIITSNNDRKEVLIKNVGWVDNADHFTYKTQENPAESIGNPQNIKEFGIYGYSKYVTYKGSIDYSSDNLSDLSDQSEPNFKEMTVFLKEIASGDKTLYSYKAQNTTKYFYSDSSLIIQPLIYKKYYPEGNRSVVATNESYISQLKTIFKDDAVANAAASKVQYTTVGLIKIFKTHNDKLSGDSHEEFQTKKGASKFNLAVRPGINFYSPLKLDGSSQNEGFPSKSGFRIGVEAELVLPFNKNKWSIIFEPTYSFYTNDKMTTKTNDQLYTITMDSYSFISLPLGIRHYMFLNDKSKFFINGQVNVLAFKSGKANSFDLDYDGTVFDKINLSSTQSFDSFSFGAGYTYNNKYTIEARYSTSKNIVADSRPQIAKIKYASLILGYNIF